MQTSTRLKRDAKYTSMPFYIRIWRDIVHSPGLYIMLLPVLAFYILFCYKPMYGALIAFMDFQPGVPIFQNSWVGFSNFVDFFQDRSFFRVIKNTLVISISSIISGFPVPIILALLINELRSRLYSRLVQTVSYLPHFISLVVICGLIRDFTGGNGIVTRFIQILGSDIGTSLLMKPSYFVPVYVISGIWQEAGYGSIIYLAALTGISHELYEAATIDGASRWKQTIHITLPGILPTIVIMLILRMGNMMNVGFEKIILLYNPQIYETADVISSFVYRKGLQEFNFSFSTAVGLFNSAINFAILLAANSISKRVNETSLW